MILIIGCGHLGSSLALKLADAGKDVTVLDHERGNIEANLPRDFPGRTLLGMEIDNEVLMRAGIDRAEAVAAVSRDESTNMMAADVARKIFGIRRVVVRIDDPRLAELYRGEGFEVISPVAAGTQALERALMSGEG